VQAIMAFPNKLNYDGSKVFKSFGIKTFLTLSLVNVFGVLLVQSMPVSLEFAESSKTIVVVYHSILAFLPMVALFLMATDRIPVGTND